MSTSVPFVDLSIVVPAYNEEHRLPPTLARLHAYLAAQPLRYEIVVVDDGSRDATCAVVQAAMASIPNLRLVRQTPNRGKGAAVRLGMLAARGQIRVMSDADGSMSPDQLPRLLAPITACKAEVSIGSRYAEGARSNIEQPWYRVLWSRIANKAVQRSLVPACATPSAASRHSPPKLRAICSPAAGSTAGRSTSRSSPSPGAPATRSPRSGSSGPTTAARGSTRSRTCGR